MKRLARYIALTAGGAFAGAWAGGVLAIWIATMAGTTANPGAVIAVGGAGALFGFTAGLWVVVDEDHEA